MSTLVSLGRLHGPPPVEAIVGGLCCHAFSSSLSFASSILHLKVEYKGCNHRGAYQMPQFVAQILSLDGDVILSNVDVSIDFSPQGLEWRGNFDLPPTATFDPNALPQRTMYKIQRSSVAER